MTLLKNTVNITRKIRRSLFIAAYWKYNSKAQWGLYKYIRPVFSYKLRYIVGIGLVKMAISTNPKPTIYRNLYENTGPGDQCENREPVTAPHRNTNNTTYITVVGHAMEKKAYFLETIPASSNTWHSPAVFQPVHHYMMLNSILYPQKWTLYFILWLGQYLRFNLPLFAELLNLLGHYSLGCYLLKKNVCFYIDGVTYLTKSFRWLT